MALAPEHVAKLTSHLGQGLLFSIAQNRVPALPRRGSWSVPRKNDNRPRCPFRRDERASEADGQAQDRPMLHDIELVAIDA